MIGILNAPYIIQTERLLMPRTILGYCKTIAMAKKWGSRDVICGFGTSDTTHSAITLLFRYGIQDCTMAIEKLRGDCSIELS